MNKCLDCGQVVGMPFWLAHSVYLYANQYGYKKRVFCHRCGAVYDHEEKHNTDEIESVRLEMSASIFRDRIEESEAR
jgi:hypothetical protein